MTVSRILEAVGAAPSDVIASVGRDVRRLTITDFMTDGSLAAVCAELSKLTGISVGLRDPDGRRIVRDADPEHPWRVEDRPAPSPGKVIPLRVGANVIGSIVVDGSPDGSAARAALERTVELIASTAAELCEHELELRDRIKEVGALYKLSSMLVRAASVERVLTTALDLALDVLGLEAGSVRLFREDADGPTDPTEADLVLKASRGLSQRFLEFPAPLSSERVFDKMALNGAIVAVEDLRADPRVALRELVEAEGLRSFLSAGLVFQRRPIGVIRLYGRTPRQFEESDQRILRSIAAQAAVAVEQARLMRVEDEERVVQRQLQLAADVQRRMLPRTTPSIPGLDIAAKYVPSFDLGGDFYDFIELHGHVGIVVGDVVGKGIAAALLMSAVRASLRAHVQEIYDIDEVVARVNMALCRDSRDHEFASLWYGVLDPVTLRMTFCSAGHEPTLVFRVPKHRAPTQADVDELAVGGMVVGIDPSQRYQRAVFELRPRDVLIAYTDGVTDVQDFQGRKFGRKRLCDSVLALLAAEPNATAHQIVEHVHWELRRFAGLSERPDDSTIVVLRVTER